MDHPAREQQAPPLPSPGPAPWSAAPADPWAPREPSTNAVAVWSWVVALPCALLGLTFGVLGLVRSRRRGGVGATHAVVGLTVSAFVLLACAALLPLAAVVGLSANAGPDGSVRASLTADEQDYLDGLYDETYYAYDDSTLLDMGHGFCDDLDTGASPADADAALVQRWAGDDLDLDTAYDVEATATTSLCPTHADEFSAWDPSETDPGLTT